MADGMKRLPARFAVFGSGCDFTFRTFPLYSPEQVCSHRTLPVLSIFRYGKCKEGKYPTMKMAVVLACNHCRQVERLKVKGWGGILTGFTGCFSRILFLQS